MRFGGFYRTETLKEYNITSDEYIYEYAVNKIFKETIDGGNFIFADNRLVINDPKYVSVSDKGDFRLTEYAENNQHECCLVFDVVLTERPAEKKDFIERIHSHTRYILNLSNVIRKTGTFFRYFLYVLFAPFVLWWWILNKWFASYPRYAKKPAKNYLYNQTDQNTIVTSHSKELQKPHDDLAEKLEYAAATKKDFSKLAWGHIVRCKCILKEDFYNRTLLSEKTYDRIKSGKLKNPNLETVIALCFGLDLGMLYGDSLLKSAGFDLSESSRPDYVAYHALLCTFQGRTIYEYNEALESLGLPPIRAKVYREMDAEKIQAILQTSKVRN